MHLQNNLLEARKRAGLTQQDAAERLTISRQAISRWESGTAKPSIENLMALAKLYGVSTDTLLYGEEERLGKSAEDAQEPEPVLQEAEEPAPAPEAPSKPAAGAKKKSPSRILRRVILLAVAVLLWIGSVLLAAWSLQARNVQQTEWIDELKEDVITDDSYATETFELKPIEWR